MKFNFTLEKILTHTLLTGSVDSHHLKVFTKCVYSIPFVPSTITSVPFHYNHNGITISYHFSCHNFLAIPIKHQHALSCYCITSIILRIS